MDKDYKEKLEIEEHVPVPKRVSTTHEDLEVFGFTASCPRCMSLLNSTKAREGRSGPSRNETNEVEPTGRASETTTTTTRAGRLVVTIGAQQASSPVQDGDAGLYDSVAVSLRVPSSALLFKTSIASILASIGTVAL